MGIRKVDIKAFNGNFISGFLPDTNQITAKISKGKMKGNINPVITPVIKIKEDATNEATNAFIA